MQWFGLLMVTLLSAAKTKPEQPADPTPTVDTQSPVAERESVIVVPHWHKRHDAPLEHRPRASG